MLDLGAYYLTRNPRAETALRLFVPPLTGGRVFSSLQSFVAVAASQNLRLSEQSLAAAAQSYASALDLLQQRDTPAESYLKQLLVQNTAVTFTSGPPAPPPDYSLAANKGLAITQGTTTVITKDQLSTTGTNTPDTNITYSVTNSPQNGRLVLAYDPGRLVTSFTQADIDAGLLKYVHNGSDTTSDSFNFTVRSGDTRIASATFDIGVTVLPKSPVVAVNNGATVAEGSFTTLTTAQLSATDGDSPATNIFYQVASGPANGQLELSTNPGTAVTRFTQAQLAAGQVRYVHNGSETTSDSFTFSVSDALHFVNGNTFNIAVTPVDDAPVVNTNSAVTVNEGGVAALTTSNLNATDADTPDSNLVYTVISGPANGQLELTTDPGTAVTSFTQADIAAGLVQYVHDGSETTADAFTFSLSDGTTTLASDTFNINVAPVDDAPVLDTNAGATVAEGGTTSITTAQLNATDVDTPDSNLVYTVASGPANGQLELTTAPGTAITSFTQADLAAGLVQYVHNGSETTSDAFTFSLSDGTTTLASDTFNINVTPVNDTPVIDANTGTTVAEGGTTVITSTQLHASDADTASSNITYTVTSAPVNGRLELTTAPGTAITSFTQAALDAGLVQYVHNSSDTVSDSFTFSVSDGNTTVSGNTFNVNVTPVDDTPTLTTNTGAFVAEGTASAITTAQLSATDTDTTDANLVYTVASGPAHGQLELTSNPGTAITSFTQADLANGLVQYVHNGSETTSDSFTFNLSDGTTTLPSATFNITVVPVDDAPVITANAGVSVNEGSSAAITVAALNATDADTPDSGLVYTVTNAPASGRLELTSAPGTAITSFTQADLAAGLVRYVNDGSEATSDSFSFTLTDGTTTLAEDTFNINVNPVDDAPILTTNAPLAVNEGDAVTVTSANLNASDVDTPNSSLVYTITSGPANGHFEFNTTPGTVITSFTQSDINAGLVQYIHNGSETTSDAFTFSLSDGTTTLSGNAGSINVTPVDDAPTVATNSGATVAEGSTVTLTTAKLSAADVDTANANLTFTVTASPANGRLQLSTNPGAAITSFTQAQLAAGLVQYVHNGSETTSDSFVFRLSDLTTTLAPVSFNITVTPVDDAPVLTTDTGTTVSRLAGSTIITTAQLSASDVDTSNANITFTVTGGLTRGHLELTTNPGTTVTSFTEADLTAGIVKYVHTSLGLAPDNFTFTVKDQTTTLSPSTFNINVTV